MVCSSHDILRMNNSPDLLNRIRLIEPVHVATRNLCLLCQMFCSSKCVFGCLVMEVGVCKLKHARSRPGRLVFTYKQKYDRFFRTVIEGSMNDSFIMFITRSKHH